MRKSIITDLFLTFARIGLFTFGGGYAMIPLIQREVVDNKHWVCHEDVLDIVAIAESTPGPIAINAATFIGKKTAGTKGAAAATLGVVFPSFLIIVAISYVLQAFEHIKAVRYAFWGIRIGVLAMILKALVTLFGHCDKNAAAFALMLFSFGAVTFFKVPVILAIVVCGAAGLLIFLLRDRKT